VIATPKGVGDLTVLGWGVFLGYFAVAALSYRAAVVCWRDHGARRSCRVWVAIAVVLVLLGINKQLDLHVWLNVFGRRLAESEGWYRNRGIAQVVFFGGVTVAVVTVYLMLIRLGRGNLRPLAGALVGVGALMAFLLIRAISFDVVDLRTDLGGFALHRLLEFFGLLLIGVSAFLAVREPESARP